MSDAEENRLQELEERLEELDHCRKNLDLCALPCDCCEHELRLPSLHCTLIAL